MLSVIAIVYGAAVSLVQVDMKKLVAYSSVSHMGFITAGLFTFNLQGIEGSVLQMVNHGILTGALFQMVGFFYERTHTRQIKDYGGMARPLPVAAAFFSLFVLGSLGLPGLNGFVGEFLILIGVFQYMKVFAVIASLGIILGAAYLLWMYQRTMFGELTNKKWLDLKDLSLREIVTLVPLAAMAVLIGVWPQPFLQMLHAPAAEHHREAGAVHGAEGVPGAHGERVPGRVLDDTEGSHPDHPGAHPGARGLLWCWWSSRF